MKLFQALKLKNKIVGEISNLKGLINQKNSVSSGEKNYYNSKDLFTKLTQHVANLADLKIAINSANAPVQRAIYELAEAKSMLNFVKSLNTAEGKIRGFRRFDDIKEDEFVVSINEADKNKLVATYQTLIDSLQDQLDIHNHTTDCNIDEKTLLINQ